MNARTSSSGREAPAAPRQAIVFTGHMVDAPGRPVPRFPPALVGAAARRIDAALAQLDAGPRDLAFTQGAAGGDLLFAESCLARGVPLRLLLPLAESEFVARSLLPVQDGAAWHTRFRAVVDRLGEAPSEAPQALGALAAGEDAFVRGNLWLLDRARAAGAERLCCICLWDGGGGDGPGGTRHLVEAVGAVGAKFVRIDTRSLRAPPHHAVTTPKDVERARAVLQSAMPHARLASTARGNDDSARRSRTAQRTNGESMAKSAAKPARKNKALSLHIGLNGVSAAAYAGWDGPLAACEFDANDMAAIARSQGMQPTVLLTRKATRTAVLGALRKAAKALAGGGFLFLSYSGHGGQIPDLTGEEDDKKDETWCLWDGQLIDDELYFELSRFAAGVRILVLSDSCHSGTVTRAALMPTATIPSQRPKLMPESVAMRTYRDHRKFYDDLQKGVASAAGNPPVDPDSAIAQVAASGRLSAIVQKLAPAVILVSGCQDNQTSMDGEHNGAFTEQLLKVWNQGGFHGNYASFHARIRARMPATQSPNLFTLGAAGRFLAQQPFSV